MNQAQEKFGPPHELARTKVRSYMDEAVRDFVRCSPFAVLASASANGDCDASPKGGRPGFVKVLDDRHLLIPDISGNRLFQSYENVETNPKAGLIFFLPGCDVTVRVNGRVRIVGKEGGSLLDIDPEVFEPDEEAKILQGLLLEVDEAYAQCPRALTFSRLWDPDTIRENRQIHTTAGWMRRWFKLPAA